MNDRINKTSICSIVFLDIIDYSKKPDSEQIEVKNQFNALINNALKDIAQNDRIILDTGDGAAIACNASPEDALFISLTIRDEILKSNIHSAMPLYVRFGINLGPVRVVSDINGQPNIIGDGINVAERVMSFAQPNQILVSRSYYEVTSRLTQEISQMFDYSGVKHDKHVREHEVYSVRLLKNQAVNEEFPSVPEYNPQPIKWLAITSKINWKHATLALPSVVAILLLIKMVPTFTAPTTKAESPSVATQAVKPAVVASVEINREKLMPNETVEAVPLEANVPAVKESKLTQKKVNVKAKKKIELQTIVAAKPVEVKTNIATNEDKSGWDTFKESVKQGSESKCAQAEISMNQCR
jgi:Adenylate and Guanylate cyclase catalytic domain